MTTIYTVGHSTRASEEFGELLRAYGIAVLVDVRQFPGSRRYPHFGSAALETSLAAIGIEYRHEVDLGGRRRGPAESSNGYWRNASFRAYADYLASEPFAAALARVVEWAERRPLAIMCSEAVPWRCHRWLISDVLVSRGVEVVHILDKSHSQPHALNANARVDPQGHLTYPLPLGF